VSAPVRVLVVDDSAFARKVVRTSLERSPHIAVVGVARDGLEALEKIAELHPDVVTLDLIMPNLDGPGVLRALPGEGAPRVVVVSVSEIDSELGIEALQLGAIDLVHKPTSHATDRLYDMGDELVRVVLAAARARPAAPFPQPGPRPQVAPASAPGRVRLVAIGGSTGGPQAVSRLLCALPASLPPIAVVLHLPGEYTGSFARRLDERSSLDVIEAEDGVPLRTGLAVIARGGHHLRIVQGEGQAVVRLDLDPATTPHRPSVDVLFESAAEAFGGDVLGVVLTGMGEDGLRGARRIRGAGGIVLTESEASSVVYGMPRAVREAGLADAEAPIDQMAELLLSRL